MLISGFDNKSAARCAAAPSRSVRLRQLDNASGNGARSSPRGAACVAGASAIMSGKKRCVGATALDPGSARA